MNNVISKESLSQLSEFIASRMGLHFPPERWNDLERNIALAAREFEFNNTEAFISWLVASKINMEQMEILASHLTINETYFWREPRVFEALTEKILPEIIRLNENGEKRLRIWSAGCATGEEPYSIAIALHRAIPKIEDWNITILATDINPRILKKAAAGIYREWSFRDSPGWLKKKYFHVRPDGEFEIDPDIRKMVRFAYLNLVEDVYPSPVNNTNAMDIIFCRNVLMYFVPGRIKQAAHNLYKSLVEGGYFMVSAGEFSQELFPQFNSISFSGAFVYRKDNPGYIPSSDKSIAAESSQNINIQHQLEQAVLPVFPVLEQESISFKILPETGNLVMPKDAYSEALSLYEEGQYSETVKKLVETPKTSVTLSVRALANQGKLKEALLLCEKAIIEEKLNPVLYYLKAAILQELNRDEDAIISLKQSLYIDPNLILAHFTLGNIMIKQGSIQTAKKDFNNALALLGMLKQDDILPESDGMTAGRFKEILNATILTGATA